MNWTISVKTTPYAERQPTGFTGDVLEAVLSREFVTSADVRDILTEKWPDVPSDLMVNRVWASLMTLKRQGCIEGCPLGGQQFAWYDPGSTGAAEVAAAIAARRHDVGETTEVTDEQWATIEPLLVGRAGKKSLAGRRQFMNGLLFVASNGLPWSKMPERFGDSQRAHQRFIRWAAIGVWDRVLAAMDGQWDRHVVESIRLRVRSHVDRHFGS